MVLFSRNRHSTARKLDGNTLEIRSSLLDSVHEMEITLTIDISTFTITDTVFVMKRAPYTFCFDIVEIASRLNGFKVREKNLGKRINQLFVGIDGCTQLADLVMEAIKMVNQSIIGLLQGGRLEMLKKYDQTLQGTCYGHSQPLDEKIKAAFSLVPGRLD